MNFPSNLEDCHKQMPYILDKYEAEFIRNCALKDMIRFHNTVGRFIRNTWGLWNPDSSKLKKYFENLGVWHAHDMSAIIMDSYWCRIHNFSFNLEERVRHYQEYWEEQYPYSIPSEFLTAKGKLMCLLK